MATPSRPLPLIPRMSCWLAACLDGRVGPDDFATGATGQDVRHLVVTPDGASVELVRLPALLFGLCGLSAETSRSTRVCCALPVPGDALGLAGPPDFNREAIEAGGAVVVAGTQRGLLPEWDARTVLWRVRAAGAPPPLDAAEHDRALRRELSAATTRLVELDVAAWRPEVADLLTPPHAGRVALPPGTPPRHAESIARALLCLDIVDLALSDEGGARSATEMTMRREALHGLERAARRVLVSTCGTQPGTAPSAR